MINYFILKPGEFEKIKKINRLKLKECKETNSFYAPYIPFTIGDHFLYDASDE